MNVLDKIQHQLLELVTAENLTVNIVRVLFVCYPTNISYLFLIPEVPTGDDLLMDLSDTITK
jgi:hypothetical protein